MDHSKLEQRRCRPEAQPKRWRGHQRIPGEASRDQEVKFTKQDDSTPPKHNIGLISTSFRTPNVPPSHGWMVPGAPMKIGALTSRAGYRNGQAVDYPILPPWRLAPRTEHYSPPIVAPFPSHPTMASSRYGSTSPSEAHIIPLSNPTRSMTISRAVKSMTAKPPLPPSPSSSYVLYRQPTSSLMADAVSGLSFERIGVRCLKAFRVKLPQHLVQNNLDQIIERAEEHAKTLSTGWKTELYSLTKCDMACRDIPGLKKYLRPIFDYICHAIQILYGSQTLIVDKNQPHILKYSAEMGHTGVELHHDRCDVTANLALSKRTDYKGGGTMLVDIDRVIRLEKGEVLLHPGSMVHGGMDITEGTRYLLVTFAHLK